MRTLTTGETCRRLGVLPWQLLGAIRRGFLAELPRHGPYRVIQEDDLPRIERALRAAGYLPEQEVAGAR